MLAAWLAIYAAGNLVLIADAGLQFRAINRFLGFKSSVDCDGRTAQLLCARCCGSISDSPALLVVLVLIGTRFVFAVRGVGISGHSAF